MFYAYKCDINSKRNIWCKIFSALLSRNACIQNVTESLLCNIFSGCLNGRLEGDPQPLSRPGGNRFFCYIGDRCGSNEAQKKASFLMKNFEIAISEKGGDEDGRD